ncbi:TetR family transcriptional regulator [Salipiger sp. P9]|uniref:TetR/AcrR family transcriptional regulator n=1 Tax=Salipiger pentaromativorans TaxID=2943193 RepID=UPI0021588E7D|nr:TetR/AcrR family transcriptional regulator [Salipiger pentaromativorans]MCR8549286.1 TetR family transcriptional regulator [Salipiger pentaromativorans]
MTKDKPLTQHELRSQATRARIVEAAHTQFVANGLEGTRMEAISAEAGVNKSLVYRHFGNRETLYREVLARAYGQIREAEAQIHLPEDPVAALDTMICFTLNYYIEHPDFLVLVGIENLNGGVHLREVARDVLKVERLVERYRTVIRCGTDAGLFRQGIDPVDLYLVVSSQCWFTVATRHTFGITFQVDVLARAEIEQRVALIKHTVLGFVLDEPRIDALLARSAKQPTAG